MWPDVDIDEEEETMSSRLESSTGMNHLLGSRRSAIVPIGLCAGILLFAVIACALPSQDSADSLAGTQLALEVQATTLALEQMQLTRQAETQQAAPPPPLPTEEPSEEPQETEEAPLETEEPESPEAEPVEGSLVRASFDPAYGWGAGHDVETFDGTKGKFPASSAGAAVAWYEGGRYHITFTSRNRWTWYWSFIDAQDFYMDVVVINGDKCVPGDTAGMVFRGDSTWDYGLMFGISCGGQYFIGFTAVPGVDGVICTFKESGIDCDRKETHTSSLIQTGPGAINRIGVRAKGQDVDFYINGKWVDSRSLALYWPAFDSGTFALYLGSAQKPDASVSFDDFSIWYLD